MTITAVKIFAKVPLPGYAKTRLAPALGDEGAAAVALALLQCSTELCAQLPQSLRVEYQLSPAPTALCWQHVHCLERFSRVDQGEGELGKRMARASSRGFAEADSVILLGTDCPSLTAAHVQWAQFALDSVDAAIIPATDGGYVLLALAAEHSAVFREIAWSTEKVLGQTRSRLKQAGLRWLEHAPLPDLDEPADIAAQPADFLGRCPPLRRYVEVAGG